MNNFDIESNPEMASSSTYLKRFNSIDNMYKLIGYNYYEYNRKSLEADMLIKYKNLCSYLKRTANSRDIDKYHKLVDGYACKTYLEHFLKALVMEFSLLIQNPQNYIWETIKFVKCQDILQKN